MLQKTIKSVINKKINEWIKTINDNSVVDAIRKDLIITGGCFPSMIDNEQPRDFDCYFRNKESLLKVANYYVNVWNENHKNQVNDLNIITKVFVLDGANPSEELLNYYNISDINQSKSNMISNTSPDRVKIIFPSDGIVGNPESVNASEELGTDIETIEEIDEVKYDEIENSVEEKYHPVFLSTNAITLSNGIQIVVRFYGEPETIHDTYDFEHTKAYYDNGSNILCIPNKVYEMVTNKTLQYTGSKYPVCSLFRLRKFISRGWTINAGQILKIAMQISELDLMDINVLEDQLIGVDSLYFMMLIDQFRARKNKDKDFDLTTSYIISIIDKIF